MHSIRQIVFSLLAAFPVISSLAQEPLPVLKTSAEAKSLSNEEFAGGLPFDFTATVIGVYRDGTVFLKDEGGYFRVISSITNTLKSGNIARVTGITKYKEDSSEVRDLVATSMVTTGTMKIPQPSETSVADIARNTERTDFVRVRGRITDAFVDEIDANWNYMILMDGADFISVAIANNGDMRSRLAGFVDAEVELTGAAYPGHAGFRIFLGPFLQLWDESCIQFTAPAPEDPFSLPRVDDIREKSPQKIATLGRRTAVGEVIAAWSGGKVLLRNDDGCIIGVSLSNAENRPNTGERITAVGYPETDLYRINLSRAQFRREKPARHLDSPPEDVSPETILLDDAGRQIIKPNYHGRLIRINGIVRATPSQAGSERLIHLECGKLIVPIDVSTKPDIADDLEIGYKVSVTGICVLESSNWRPSMVFPHFDRLLVVPRSRLDIVVLSRPPWWTTARLLAFIGTLLAALIIILIWNFSLRRLAERRGKKLYRAEISKASAELRIDERTRLAAELHDAIAQNLTGVSLQIAAARQAKTSNPEAEDGHLATADQMLRSSRVELRRCIWDLRSEALDVPDFAEAIRRTVQPVVGKAVLSVACDIPRSKLSDSTTHALLRIVRELASNAASHGKATGVTIEGTDLNGTARIRVTDNGCGFAPDNCPGQNEGHFGLKGIRERIKRLDGNFSISSTIGEGTVATIEITIK